MLNEANDWANKTQVIVSSGRGMSGSASVHGHGTPKVGTGRRSSHISSLLHETFRGKENLTLKPYLRNYENVDEHVKAIRQLGENYQLIIEKKPLMVNNVSGIQSFFLTYLYHLAETGRGPNVPIETSRPEERIHYSSSCSVEIETSSE